MFSDHLISYDFLHLLGTLEKFKEFMPFNTLCPLRQLKATDPFH